MSLRGGLAAGAASLTPTTIDGTFNLVFAVLAASCASLVAATRERTGSTREEDGPSKDVRSLQRRFLLVFWLYKMADWLQGPYFYEVYASKVLNGVAVSSTTVARLFLTGFGTTALFGALVGGWVDSVGRKRGSLAFALLYALSALSTRCNTLGLLLAGRVAGGIGTSLLFSAPEAWLVSEHQRSKFDGRWLSQTFGLAYFGDAIVAIAAGQVAGAVAGASGPSAPFTLSTLFLAAGAALVAATWRENYGGKAAAEGGEGKKEKKKAAEEGGGSGLSLVREAVGEMRKDKKILLVGGVQALFEGAMYIFVLQWPPAMKSLISSSVPFGKVFSCFMVCCMLGSTTFSALSRRGVPAEKTMLAMLALAASSMGLATAYCGAAIVPLVAAFFLFEACVGMYFPLIGSLRSKYLPDAYRGVIMNLFAIPLNLIVCGVYLCIRALGVGGALGVSSLTLAGAFLSMLGLSRTLADRKSVV